MTLIFYPYRINQLFQYIKDRISPIALVLLCVKFVTLMIQTLRPIKVRINWFILVDVPKLFIRTV